MIVPPDLFTITHHKLIIEQAAHQRLPVIYGLSLARPTLLTILQSTQLATTLQTWYSSFQHLENNRRLLSAMIGVLRLRGIRRYFGPTSSAPLWR
jgi:hypothetical protein